MVLYACRDLRWNRARHSLPNNKTLGKGCCALSPNSSWQMLLLHYLSEHSVVPAPTPGKELEPTWLRNKHLNPATLEKQALGPQAQGIPWQQYGSAVQAQLLLSVSNDSKSIFLAHGYLGVGKAFTFSPNAYINKWRRIRMHHWRSCGREAWKEVWKQGVKSEGSTYCHRAFAFQ